MIEIIILLGLILGIVLVWMVFFFGWRVVKAVKNWRRGVHE
jgi:hypothetical protein